MSYISCSVERRRGLSIGLLYLFLNLVPFDISVVVALEAWTGDFPSCTHVENLSAFVGSRAFLPLSVLHLQIEGRWLVATTQHTPQDLDQSPNSMSRIDQRLFEVFRCLGCY